ncbi:1476_t:CDS:2 [Funneliformis caledonium]|uniref:1476_t:CDS:1 n=2 Tax=Funneliformis TaxID=1117308 RepID=A0A9N9FZV4_9GLOM|nr:8591_t:CDS:2 [Funneliformis mosseae]CAG8574808.1 1476_t:CDS:2 [Funneliformis caledonium]
MAENVRNMISPGLMILNQRRRRRNYTRIRQTTQRQGLRIVIGSFQNRTQINNYNTLNRMSQLTYQATDNTFADQLFNGTSSLS